VWRGTARRIRGAQAAVVATSLRMSSERPPVRSGWQLPPPGQTVPIESPGRNAGGSNCRVHRELVLADQRLRNEICWCVFEG
jgi:hypothetical protein